MNRLSTLSLPMLLAIGLLNGATTRREDASCQWHQLGPLGVEDGEGFDGAAVSVSGRVTAIAIAKESRLIFAGSALGGVWKSTDQGREWSPLTDDAVSLAVGAIAINPKRESEIYVGTGEANIALRDLFVRHDRPLSGDQGQGLLKSEDGGRSWVNLAKAEFDGYAFSFLQFAAKDAGTLYAGTTGGLFRSTDQGRSWNRVPLPSRSKPVTSLAFDPDSPEHAFIGVFGVGVFECHSLQIDMPDCQLARNGLPLSNISRVEIVIGKQQPFRVFAYIADAAGSLRGLYSSDDIGRHWYRIENAPDLFQGQGFYNEVLAVDPRDSSVIFLGGAGDRNSHRSSLYKGRRVDDKWLFAPVGGAIHIDLHALVFDESSADTMYAGSDGGVWKSTDGGMTWKSINRGLATLQITRFDQHPGRLDFVIAGTQDNGTLRLVGQQWHHVDNGDGGYVAISRSRPNVVYDEYMLYKVARSTAMGDAGTFIPSYPNVRFARSVFLAPFVVDSANGDRLFLGLEKLYESKDGGRSWLALSLDLTRGWTDWLDTHAISCMTFLSSERLAVGTSDGRLWVVSHDTGSWRATELQIAGPLGSLGYVTSLAFDARHPNQLFASGDRSGTSPLWTCDIALATCKSLMASGLPMHAIFSLEFLAPDDLVAGTDFGVYRSRDLGVSWTNWSDGLPRTAVFQLQRHPLGGVVRAGTFGRGLWERIIGEQCP
jgi:photosystem II stability/assembly factor-like uncharacterized protein